MPKSQQFRRLSLVSRAGFFSFLAPKVHLQGASASSQCRGWRGRGSWKNQENLFLIIMGYLHIITALVYRALSQTLSHLILTVNGESGGGGGNRAISTGPTLSNRTTGGSERVNDLSRITKPVSSGAGNASFMTLVSWPQLPLLELYLLESESDSFRLWISSVCPLSPNNGEVKASKRCLGGWGTKQDGFECHGQGIWQEGNRLSMCSPGWGPAGCPRGKKMLAECLPNRVVFGWETGRGEMGRNSTEESGAAVAESFCCPPKVITMLICYTSPWASFPGGSDGKESTCNAGDLSLIPGSGKIPWRRAWQPTPVFLPGEFHGQRSLAGYRRDWMTETFIFT